MKKIPVIAVVGPTASGKTALAIEIALAVGGEVISADSMQIYRGMDIATAKPTAEEMRGVRHRMLDFLPPEEEYSVAKYVEDAARAIDETVAEGKIPVICGGTGLYIDALLGNMNFAPEENTGELRETLNARCESEGAQALLDELSAIDPDYAATLHPNNKKRIIRALEIYMQTGKIPSEARAEALSGESRYDVLYLGLDYKDRQKLYDRINRRVDKMLSDGLVAEAEKYFSSAGSTAVQAIGYKELSPFLAGECTLGEAAEALKQSTRRYAKRQLTWFRRNTEIFWLYPDEEGMPEATRGAVALSSDFISGRKEESQ